MIRVPTMDVAPRCSHVGFRRGPRAEPAKLLHLLCEKSSPFLKIKIRRSWIEPKSDEPWVSAGGREWSNVRLRESLRRNLSFPGTSIAAEPDSKVGVVDVRVLASQESRDNVIPECGNLVSVAHTFRDTRAIEPRSSRVMGLFHNEVRNPWRSRR